VPLITHLPIDFLEMRATEALLQIARLDTDLIGQPIQGFYDFAEERRAVLRVELATVQKEVEALGSDWNEFYALLVDKVQIYDSARDDEGECYDSE